MMEQEQHKRSNEDKDCSSSSSPLIGPYAATTTAAKSAKKSATHVLKGQPTSVYENDAVVVLPVYQQHEHEHQRKVAIVEVEEEEEYEDCHGKEEEEEEELEGLKLLSASTLSSSMGNHSNNDTSLSRVIDSSSFQTVIKQMQNAESLVNVIEDYDEEDNDKIYNNTREEEDEVANSIDYTEKESTIVIDEQIQNSFSWESETTTVDHNKDNNKMPINGEKVGDATTPYAKYLPHQYHQEHQSSHEKRQYKELLFSASTPHMSPIPSSLLSSMTKTPTSTMSSDNFVSPSPYQYRYLYSHPGSNGKAPSSSPHPSNMSNPRTPLMQTSTSAFVTPDKYFEYEYDELGGTSLADELRGAKKTIEEMDREVQQLERELKSEIKIVLGKGPSVWQNVYDRRRKNRRHGITNSCKKDCKERGLSPLSARKASTSKKAINATPKLMRCSGGQGVKCANNVTVTP